MSIKMIGLELPAHLELETIYFDRKRAVSHAAAQFTISYHFGIRTNAARIQQCNARITSDDESWACEYIVDWWQSCQLLTPKMRRMLAVAGVCGAFAVDREPFELDDVINTDGMFSLTEQLWAGVAHLDELSWPDELFDDGLSVVNMLRDPLSIPFEYASRTLMRDGMVLPDDLPELERHKLLRHKLNGEMEMLRRCEASLGGRRGDPAATTNGPNPSSEARGVTGQGVMVRPRR